MEERDRNDGLDGVKARFRVGGSGKPAHVMGAVQFLVILAALGFVGIIVHELGHGLTAEIVGGEFKALAVWPGVELWPDLGARRANMSGYFGMATTSCRSLGETKVHAVRFMGAGSTLAISLISTILLWVLRPKRRFVRHVLIALSLYFMDILTYTFCPQLGMPRFILVGRTTHHSEPLAAAVGLGVPKPLFNALIILISALILVAIARVVLLSGRGHRSLATR